MNKRWSREELGTEMCTCVLGDAVVEEGAAGGPRGTRAPHNIRAGHQHHVLQQTLQQTQEVWVW